MTDVREKPKRDSYKQAAFTIFPLKRMSLNVGLWKESVYSERIAEANEDSLSIVEERDEWQEALWVAV